MATVFRYTSEGQSVLWRGRIEVPHSMTELADHLDDWIPYIMSRDVVVYFTYAGKQKYDRTLLPLHKKYLPNIKLETIDSKKLGEIAYQDEYVIAFKKENK